MRSSSRVRWIWGSCGKSRIGSGCGSDWAEDQMFDKCRNMTLIEHLISMNADVDLTTKIVRILVANAAISLRPITEPAFLVLHSGDRCGGPANVRRAGPRAGAG